MTLILKNICFCRSIHIINIFKDINWTTFALHSLLFKFQRNSIEAAQIFHDTAGWKSLETWMK